MNKLSLARLVCSVILALCYENLCEAATTWDDEMKTDQDLEDTVDNWKCQSKTWTDVPKEIKDKYVECRTTYPRNENNVNFPCIQVCLWKKIGVINGTGHPIKTRIEELGKQMHGNDNDRKDKWFGKLSRDCSKAASSYLEDKNYDKTMTGNCPKAKAFVKCRISDEKEGCPSPNP